MKELVKKLEKISVGKEVINVAQPETNVASVEVVKKYGDVEIILFFDIEFTEGGAGYSPTTLVNGVNVGSGFLDDTFDLREHTKTMNAGICAIQTKNARKWVGKIFPLVDEQINDIVFGASEEKLIAQENEDFQEELELEELEETLEEEYGEENEEESNQDELDEDEDEYDALADLLDF